MVHQKALPLPHRLEVPKDLVHHQVEILLAIHLVPGVPPLLVLTQRRIHLEPGVPQCRGPIRQRIRLGQEVVLNLVTRLPHPHPGIHLDRLQEEG